MIIATVMVYVDPEQQAEGQVRITWEVADKFGASLVGVSAFAVEPPFVAEGVIIRETTADDLKRMKSARADKEQWFRSVAGLPEGRVEWRCSVDYPTAFLTNEGAIGRLGGDQAHARKMDQFHFIDPAEAMMRMGRPTLLVPDHVATLNADRVLVGWKDTREATIAVRNALPFLSRATQVTVVEISTSDEQDTARHRVRDVAKYLQAHAVKCQVDVRVHMAEPDVHQLVRLAKDEGAHLIVTGSYGHSRLGEWMFGGVTRGLLHESPVCVMMSH
ncbi:MULTISPECIES: universal stress protein [Bradyrhizobium]|uniref:Nucleotide-binding universal stress UspA family protein n=1 Tax=Bradyrhizobium elkanii TaxID=29448 RepID=A0A8I2C134_BRAEL|nr:MULTISPECIES: universal stress protein [Bradyrhizobium]MBP1290964.1 nucleotide-binding universal stress UspA family protein [Bradyrhizobium elkanii]MCP1928721.1 nucleotide-binding universal stress UspA family protein [Bradyrhizobium elkanii]MCS3473957.1 nucleotide-binding universal stress UspA family protein [Bradyrhizobium elkanii]MCS3580664.1 nucleotide-binding universal stress UspA family protein [Bradyrhizobium elkanii]MCS3723540.1 nucleotide-binding universal stress UspA family protein